MILGEQMEVNLRNVQSALDGITFSEEACADTFFTDTQLLPSSYGVSISTDGGMFENCDILYPDRKDIRVYHVYNLRAKKSACV